MDGSDVRRGRGLGPPPLLWRCATYNVCGGLWIEEARTASAVVGVLEELDADVVALQEIHPPASRAERWSASAVDRAGYEVVYGPTLEKARGPFGNALLSRHPIAAVRRIDLSLPGREPRGALDVTILRQGRELRVVATHLGLRGSERSAQVVRLLERLGPLDSGLVVLLGDINEWRARGACLRGIEGCFGNAPWVRSFPSRRPVFALDRVWTSPREALVKVEAHRTPLSAVASDHVPVVATLVQAAP